MVERLYVDNYKCLVDFELKLEELTLLLGANGSGKSSVLDVVIAVRKLLTEGVRVTDKEAFPLSSLTRWQTRREQVVALRVALDEDTFDYRLEIQHDDKMIGRARIMLERLSVGDRPLFEFKEGAVQLYNDDHEYGPVFTQDWSESQLARVVPGPSNTRLTNFINFIHKVIVCSLIPPLFRAESTSEDVFLSRDGANFADWYRSMVQEQAHLAHPFTEALREVIDGFEAIHLDRLGVESRALRISFRQDAADDFRIHFSELSDGQRALIALYGLLHLTEGQGYTLFVDEPDNYVALAEIQPWLVNLSEACGDTLRQAVVCSHHPELIDYLGGECGVLLEQKYGAATAERLDPALLSNGLALSEIVASGWEK